MLERPTSADVSAAAIAVTPWVRRTPTLTAAFAAPAGPVEVLLKLECFQYAGSFKPRGAFWSVLSAPSRPDTLVAASGGNHGLAVAHVGQALGIPARVFVPTISSPVKVRAIASRGAQVVQIGATYAEALAASQQAAAAPGALAIHAYDSATTVAGQGTLGRELLEQVPEVDTVLVAVGGGGLASGVRLALPDSVSVVAVETEGCATYAAAVAAGRPATIAPTGLAADALGASRLGDHAWAVLHRSATPSLVVSDTAVAEARRVLWESLRVVAEPAGATALAAVLTGVYRPAPDERVVVVVCGANTDPSDLVEP